jgi:hypothetical protein
MAESQATVATFGLSDAAEAIRDRIGRNARYSIFVPPSVGDDRQPRRSWDRWLWWASLCLLFIVLVLAVLVALGL